MAVVETHLVPSLDAYSIPVDLYLPDAAPPERVVVMCHGFKGHRRWGFIPHLAASLVDAGIAALAMDFSLNGHHAAGSADATDAFPAPDAFRANTIAREHDDLARAIAWVRAGGPGRFGAPVVGLWGHSRGGVAAILAALDDPAVPALVTWSTAAHPDFYSDHQKARWREQGAYEFTDTATGTPLALDVAYLDDLERHAGVYALAERASALRAAHLIVHGEQDMVIPIDDAVRLYDTEGMAADKKLIRLATGHTFGYEGGDAPPSEAQAIATRKTVEWFDEYLPGKTT